MAIATVNPATGETLEVFAPHSEDEVERRLALAARTFTAFRRLPFAERGHWLAAAALLLDAEADALGRRMATEMGKTRRAAADEARKCARACRHYAEHGERMLADEEVKTEARLSFIRHEPVGPVLAVMPWNFPFWQVFRFAAPALMAGNVALLKHASNVPRSALAIEDLLRRAGFPAGAFQTLLVGSDRVARIIEDPRIAAVTLTGSEAAGRAVAAAAGRAIKKTVLELGGSDPFVVLPSADLDRAARTAVVARTLNNGQSCIAAKRFIVAEPIADAFTARLVAGMKALRTGDPLDDATDVGPLATRDQLATVDRQVRESVAAGARLLLGGRPLERPGWFYPPTVLADIPEASPAYREEVFGPVALVFRVPDLEAAIRLANDTAFGLGAAAWTADEAEQSRLVAGIEAGAVFVNGMVASDPRLPFGGIKRSGYGRELATHGIREFVNVKTVWIGP